MARHSRVAYQLPKCQVVTLPDHQVSFQIGGSEQLRWHFDPKYPRPFFFPFNGPSGNCLTRMGHPGASNHDHHRSVWFAHAKIDGENFWSDNSAARVRQKMWLAYADGSDRVAVTEGITYFYHVANPDYPAHWHVWADGWMGASLCRHEAIAINKAKPLHVRYMLHAHSCSVNPVAAHIVRKGFNANCGFEVFASNRSHHQFEVRREMVAKK